MGTAIDITSGKGGTGKTACTAAIGSFLARSGHTVLCVDCDAALRNLDLTLGMGEAVLWDFMDVLEGRVSPSEAPAEHPDIPGLFFLAAPADLSEDAEERFASLTRGWREEYDFVLLDSPAGIGPGFRMAARGADMAILVATGDLTSLRDGQRAAQELKALGVSELRLLVNRVKPRDFRRISRTVDDVIDAVGARLLGVISEDRSVWEAGNLQTPLMLYGSKRAWYQFRDAAGRLTGEKIRLGKI